MKIECNDDSILFSSTIIPDIFFTEYLPQAPSDYIKVYLYIVFISKYGKEIKFNDISKKLALHINVIQDALKYWEDNGVLTKKTTGYILNNLREIELHNLYKPKVALSAEDIEKWTIDYNYPLEVIEIALKRTTSKANPSFDYLNATISNWYERNLKSVEDVQNFLAEFKAQQKNIKDLEKKSKFNNYEQRNYNNFDNLYANFQNEEDN